MSVIFRLLRGKGTSDPSDTTLKSISFRNYKIQKDGAMKALVEHNTLLNSLGSHNLRMAVRIPDSIASENEWLALNLLEFFNDTSMIWGCAILDAEVLKADSNEYSGFPPGYEYRAVKFIRRHHGKSVKEAVKCTASAYVEHVMDWLQDEIDLLPPDTTVLEKSGPSFKRRSAEMYRRLFRIYIIILATHTDVLQRLDMLAHVNTCFKHLLFFCIEYSLLNEREFEPIQEIVDNFMIDFVQEKRNGKENIAL
jgi:MOB kinase activator 1